MAKINLAEKRKSSKEQGLNLDIAPEMDKVLKQHIQNLNIFLTFIWT